MIVMIEYLTTSSFRAWISSDARALVIHFFVQLSG